MTDPIAICDGCGTAARRRAGFLCPDSWFYMAKERRRVISVVWACSEACRDGLWQLGVPANGELCTGCNSRPGSGFPEMPFKSIAALRAVWWSFVAATSQTTGKSFSIWACPACRDRLWQRGPGPAGAIEESAKHGVAKQISGTGKIDLRISVITPQPRIRQPIVCADHGSRPWQGHIACANCGRGYQTHNVREPLFAPDTCECNARLAPGDPSQDFSARPICDQCFALLRLFSGVARSTPGATPMPDPNQLVLGTLLVDIKLVVAGTPGLRAKVEHLNGVLRVTDERGPWVDVDEMVFASGKRHHWEPLLRARLGELADLAAAHGKPN